MSVLGGVVADAAPSHIGTVRGGEGNASASYLLPREDGAVFGVAKRIGKTFLRAVNVCFHGIQPVHGIPGWRPLKPLLKQGAAQSVLCISVSVAAVLVAQETEVKVSSLFEVGVVGVESGELPRFVAGVDSPLCLLELGRDVLRRGRRGGSGKEYDEEGGVSELSAGHRPSNKKARAQGMVAQRFTAKQNPNLP